MRILYVLIAVCLFSCSSVPHSVIEHKSEIITNIVQSTVMVSYTDKIGSGVLFQSNDKSYMLTAAHVLEDSPPMPLLLEQKIAPRIPTYGTGKIVVIGHKCNTETVEYVSGAKLVFVEPILDVAILELDCVDPSMSFTKFGNKLPDQGDDIYMCGSPLFENKTLSKGIVCHNRRRFFDPTVEETPLRFIHVDADGGPGSSGGGLFRCEDGACIGVVVRGNRATGMMYCVFVGDIITSINSSSLAKKTLILPTT